MADILLTDLTNGSVVAGKWEGTGVLDVLLETINSNIEIQYDSGRIAGPDYASVYLGSMQSAISEAVNFLLQEKQVEANIGLAEEKLDTEKINQDAIIAKVRDEHGKIIDGSGTITIDTANTNAHYYEQGIREQEDLKREEEVKIAAATADNTITDGYAKIAVILRDYGYTVAYDIDGNPTFTPLDSSADVSSTNATLPTSKHEATMMKARTEANIAINTGKGYLSDVLYKQTKVLQELTFSLANAGVISEGNAETAGSIYDKISTAMEKAMNGMTEVYGNSISTDDVAAFIDIDGTTDTKTVSLAEGD